MEEKALENNEVENELEYEIEDDTPEIEVVDDTPEADRNRKPIGAVEVDDNELSQYSDNVQKRIRDLRHAYHDERREKERILREQQEAINYAKAVAEQNNLLQQRLSNGERVLVESEKSRIEARMSAVEKQYKEAYESGDPDKMIEAQKNIAKYSIEKQNVENYQPVHQAPLQPPRIPVESYPQIVPDERTKRWVENNQWFNEDPIMRGAAYGLHDELLSKGVSAGSELYFEQIDARMKDAFPQKFGSSGKAEKRPANVVSPVTRTSSGRERVKISKSAAAIAKRLNVPIELYIKQVRKDFPNV
jgi:hypothetical protein